MNERISKKDCPLHCDISKKACVARQSRYKVSWNKLILTPWFPGCAKCAYGKRIAEELKADLPDFNAPPDPRASNNPKGRPRKTLIIPPWTNEKAMLRELLAKNPLTKVGAMLHVSHGTIFNRARKYGITVAQGRHRGNFR